MPGERADRRRGRRKGGERVAATRRLASEDFSRRQSRCCNRAKSPSAPAKKTIIAFAMSVIFCRNKRTRGTRSVPQHNRTTILLDFTKKRRVFVEHCNKLTLDNEPFLRDNKGKKRTPLSTCISVRRTDGITRSTAGDCERKQLVSRAADADRLGKTVFLKTVLPFVVYKGMEWIGGYHNGTCKLERF